MSTEISNAWNDLASIPADPPETRQKCIRCRRPKTVCWCPFLPHEPLDIRSTVIILQHPGEEKRCLRTAPMLEFALPSGQFFLYRGRHFSSQTSKALKSALENPHSILLYPGVNAVNLESYVETTEQPLVAHSIIILDGTWPQARSLYANNEELHKLKQVQINSTSNSEYVIRTQPTESALSTVETAAIALSILEGKPHIKSVLEKPLKALCAFQLAHGAVTHHSKEYLVKNGYCKSQGKVFPSQRECLV